MDIIITVFRQKRLDNNLIDKLKRAIWKVTSLYFEKGQGEVPLQFVEMSKDSVGCPPFIIEVKIPQHGAVDATDLLRALVAAISKDVSPHLVLSPKSIVRVQVVNIVEFAIR